MKLVTDGIRLHSLAGDWKTASGDYISIGCSGAFSANIVDGQWAIPGSKNEVSIPATSQESGSHIKQVDDQGFVVSHWPFASQRYDVDSWAHQNAKGVVEMNMEGKTWTRTQDLSCD